MSAVFVSIMILSAISAPVRAGTGDAIVWTGKGDYSPEETVTIYGTNFLPNTPITVDVARPDGHTDSSLDQGASIVYKVTITYCEDGTTDSNGDFTATYQLDGISGTYAVTATDGVNTATTTFTDSPKVGSVTVSAQSPNPVTAGSNATYTITVNRGSGGGSSGAFTATLSITTSLPTGASYSFSPNPVSFTSSDNSKTATLNITTSASTPGGTTSFTVNASTSASDYASNTGSLIVSAPSTYSVTFTESGLPSGTSWSATFNSVTLSNTSSTITFTGISAGSYSWNVSTTISGSAGTQYVASTSSGTMSVPSQTSQSITYTTQYQLTMATNFGTTSPSAGDHWYNAGSVVSIEAYSPSVVAGERYVWNGWTGTGTISYTGAVNQTSVTMNSPVTETASLTHQWYITVTSAHDTPTASTWVNAGESFTASVTSPADIVAGDHQWVCTGYTLDSNSPVTDGSTTYGFTNVQAAHTITFNWNEQFWIQVNSGHDSPTASQWVDQGGSLTVSVTSPADESGGTRYNCTGYTLDSDAPVTDGSTTYGFTNVQAAHTITFNWIAQYKFTVASDHDSPVPGVGDHWYDTGTHIDASVTSPADESGGTRYRCTGYTGTGSLSSGSGTSVGFDIGAPSTLTWNWMAQYYLTVGTNPAGLDGPTGEDWYDSGDTAHVSTAQYVDIVSGSSRYRFDSWTGASGTYADATVVMDSAKTATANYVTQYCVAFDQSGVGSDFTGTVVTIDGTGYGVSGLSASFWWDDQSTHSFSFSSPLAVDSDKQYVWTSTGGLSSAQGDPNFEVTGSGTVTGNYKTQYYLTVTSAYDTPGGEGWYDSGDTAYATLDTGTVTDGGTRYVFTGWSGDASGTGLTSDGITMDGAKTATADWKTQYYLTVTSDYDTPGGMEWYDGGVTAYATLDTGTVSGGAGTRYVFTGWSGDASGTGLTSDGILMNEPKTATANWQTQYQLTMATNFGTTSPSVGDHWYDAGSTVTISATAPTAGSGEQYVWNGWAGSGTGCYAGADNPATDAVTMNGPVTETASWTHQWYITITSAHGSPTQSSQWVNDDDPFSVSVTTPDVVTADEHQWVLTGLTVDGTPQTLSDTVSYDHVHAAHTILFSWTEQFYITVTSDHDTPTASTWVDQGDDFTASVTSPADITASDQWVCTGYAIDGGSSTAGTSYTFTAVGAAHTIVFSWHEQFFTSIAYSGDTSGQYSDPISLRATLSYAGSGDPIPGKTVTFTLGSQSVTATTDGSGIATASLTLTQPSGSYTVIASFAGDTDCLPSSDSDPFTIEKETVVITYTGDTYVITAGPTVATAPVRLAAQLVQEADGNSGDITLARVEFTLTSLDSPPASTIIVHDVPVNSSGYALTTKNVPVGLWLVTVTVESSNQYWRQSTAGIDTLYVEGGTGNQMVTGGGWISDPQSINGKGNFGFTVQYQKKGAPKGNFIYLFRGDDGYNYLIKSNSWQDGGLSFTGTNTAFFTGRCNIQKIDRTTGLVVESFGNYRFTVEIKDGTTRTSDTFALKVWNPTDGTVYREIGTSALGGGNLVVHSK